jgi:hypothetical protein
MTECCDEKWNMSCEKLGEFKLKNGHCMVPRAFDKDESPGEWVTEQRKVHDNDTIRPDRKRVLDKIGFAWKADDDHTFKPDHKLWHQEHEKLVEFKQNNGHCMVPRRCKQDEALGEWLHTQRKRHDDEKMQPD